MEVFDRLIPDFIDKYDIPGGAVAISQRRCDWALPGDTAWPTSGMQSPSEPEFSGSASPASPSQSQQQRYWTLVEDGKLDLDEKAFEILGRFKEPEGTSRDPRIDEVTVRQLLHHSGGWDSGSSYDPMWSVWRTGRGTDARPPITCRHVNPLHARSALGFRSRDALRLFEFRLLCFGTGYRRKDRPGVRTLRAGEMC